MPRAVCPVPYLDYLGRSPDVLSPRSFRPALAIVTGYPKNLVLRRPETKFSRHGLLNVKAIESHEPTGVFLRKVPSQRSETAG